ERWRFPLLAGLELLSLVVLLWPVLRGVPWRQVRQEVGLIAGRRGPLEPLLGVGCYAMTLPMLAAGVIVMLLCRSIYERLGLPDSGNPADMPRHPIVEFVVHGNWWLRLQLLFLGSVVAPVGEETVFPGGLYRHLREASCRWGPVLSVVFSGALVSFLFAVIHPQGLLAVPALMGLACGFTLAREWRETLIPGMVAHGLSNGVVMVFLMVAMG